MVNYMVSSPSGDWTKDLYHCYREDGSLARVNIHFGSFVDGDGGLKLDRYMYFDRNGKLEQRLRAAGRLCAVTARPTKERLVMRTTWFFVVFSGWNRLAPPAIQFKLQLRPKVGVHFRTKNLEW